MSQPIEPTGHDPHQLLTARTFETKASRSRRREAWKKLVDLSNRTVPDTPTGWVVLIDRPSGQTEVLDAYVFATPADAAKAISIIGNGDGTGTYRLAALIPAALDPPINQISA